MGEGEEGMDRNTEQGRHAQPVQADGRPPWMIPPKKRKMPKPMKKLLVVLGVIALAVLAVYIYLLLNPSVGRHVEYR